MAESILRAYGIEHPAPHAGKVSTWLVLLALLAAPGAWSLQLLVNYGLASHACFPRSAPKGHPSWDWLWPSVLAINLFALFVAAAATFISLLIWRRIRSETRGGHGQLIHAGEGRSRFLAVWGIWSGLWFVIGIIFNLIAAVGVPACTG